MTYARSIKQAYLAAAAVTIAALLVRFLLDPLLGGLLPFYVFYFASIVAALYGGYGPGFLTIATGFALGAYFFMVPRYSFDLDFGRYEINVLRFLTVAPFMVFIVARLRSAVLRFQRRPLFPLSVAPALVTTPEPIAAAEEPMDVDDVKRFLTVVLRELHAPVVPAVDPLVVLERSGADTERAIALIRAHRERSTLFMRQLGRRMELCRVAGGAEELAKEVVDVRRIVAQAVECVHASTGVEALDVGIDMPLTPVQVHGDALRLRQVMEELLEDMPHDGGVRAMVYCRSGEAVVALLSEGAQGPLPLEHAVGELPASLDPAQRTTALHGGRIRMQEKDGARSFFLSLPLLGGPYLVMEPVLPSKKAMAGPRTGPLRVLIRTEDQAFAGPLSALLSAQGHAAFIARDTEAPLDRPDVVLIDLAAQAAEGHRSTYARGEGPLLLACLREGQEQMQQERDLFDGVLVRPASLA